jgi:hypothetical protein
MGTVPIAGTPDDHSLDRVDQAVLDVLLSFCKKDGKLYCSPSPEEIIRCCLDWHSVRISTRTLAGRLKRLEELALFTRTKRYRRGPNGVPICKSPFSRLKAGLSDLAGSLARFSSLTTHL